MTSEPTKSRDWDYRITRLIRTVDGDTFDLTVEAEVDFGFRLIETKSWSTRFRLLGCDAWEKNETGGSSATAYSDAWIKAALASDLGLRGQTFKTDDFGRWLIDLYRPATATWYEEHLSERLIREGHAVPYVKK